METCLSGQSLSLAVQATVSATSARYRVLDHAEQELLSWQLLDFGHIPIAPGDAGVVPLSAAMTTLPLGQTTGLRIVRVEYLDSDGAVLRSEEQIVTVRAETRLQVHVNSFVSYYTAVMVAGDLPTNLISGWETQFDRAAREAALAEAYSRIVTLPLVLSTGPVKDMKEIDWLRIEPAEASALAKAQLFEAAEILQSDPVSEARAAGAISMTVGESSQFFGNARPLQIGRVSSKQVLKVLGPWLRFGAKVGRA